MATRRSKRTGGPKLSNFIDELTTQAKIAVPGELREAREAKYAGTKFQFELLELLPELRLRIYAFAMTTDEPRDLKTLRLPTLALVSKQVRAECLPVFFSECEVSVNVTSNYLWARELDAKSSAGTLRSWFEGPCPARTRTRASGRVTVFRRTEKMLEQLHKRENIDIAFRNVTLLVDAQRCVHGESTVVRLRTPAATKARPVVTYMEPEEECDCYDCHGPSDPELEIVLGAGSDAESDVSEDTRLRGVDLRPLRRRVRPAIERIAREIAAERERFVGFTLDDVEMVAAGCRYWPEGGMTYREAIGLS